VAKPLGHIEGMAEIRDLLKNQAPKEARNLARNTVQGVAQQVAKRIAQRAPNHKRLKKGFVAQRRRGQPNAPQSTVHARKGSMWHWFEFGTQPRVRTSKGNAPTGRIQATPYITPTVEEMRPRMPEIYREQFGKKLEAALRRAAKRVKK
jgi:hypothetical protein